MDASPSPISPPSRTTSTRLRWTPPTCRCSPTRTRRSTRSSGELRWGGGAHSRRRIVAPRLTARAISWRHVPLRGPTASGFIDGLVIDTAQRSPSTKVSASTDSRSRTVTPTTSPAPRRSAHPVRTSTRADDASSSRTRAEHPRHVLVGQARRHARHQALPRRTLRRRRPAREWTTRERPRSSPRTHLGHTGFLTATAYSSPRRTLPRRNLGASPTALRHRPAMSPHRSSASVRPNSMARSGTRLAGPARRGRAPHRLPPRTASRYRDLLVEVCAWSAPPRMRSRWFPRRAG